MFNKFLSVLMSAIFSVFLLSGIALAVEAHTAAALEHATAAAAAKDAATVSTHAGEALKHIAPAKEANKADHQVVKHLDEAEGHLKAAADAAAKNDFSAALKHAERGKVHLEEAGKIEK